TGSAINQRPWTLNPVDGDGSGRHAASNVQLILGTQAVMDPKSHRLVERTRNVAPERPVKGGSFHGPVRAAERSMMSRQAPWSVRAPYIEFEAAPSRLRQ